MTTYAKYADMYRQRLARSQDHQVSATSILFRTSQWCGRLFVSAVGSFTKNIPRAAPLSCQRSAISLALALDA